VYNQSNLSNSKFQAVLYLHGNFPDGLRHERACGNPRVLWCGNTRLIPPRWFQPSGNHSAFESRRLAQNHRVRADCPGSARPFLSFWSTFKRLYSQDGFLYPQRLWSVVHNQIDSPIYMCPAVAFFGWKPIFRTG